MDKQQKIQWIIERHKSTNHMYDKYLPYEFHLRMVVQAFEEWNWMIEDELEDGDIPSVLDTVEMACWAHDLIEDTRTTYNDVVQVLGKDVADIVYAVTNEKGKNRAERANDKYYEGIRNTPYATFVKLCDRLANVQYSKMTKSSMFDKYVSEHYKFSGKIFDEKKPKQYTQLKEHLHLILFEDYE